MWTHKLHFLNFHMFFFFANYKSVNMHFDGFSVKDNIKACKLRLRLNFLDEKGIS